MPRSKLRVHLLKPAFPQRSGERQRADEPPLAHARGYERERVAWAIAALKRLRLYLKCYGSNGHQEAHISNTERAKHDP